MLEHIRWSYRKGISSQAPSLAAVLSRHCFTLFLLHQLGTLRVVRVLRPRVRLQILLFQLSPDL